jgi:hypothetical protein
MKILAAFIAAFLPLTLLAVEEYEIKVSKKTDSKRESEIQQIARLSTRATSKQVYYQFNIRRKTATSPERVIVEYGVLVEGVGGQLQMREYDSEEVALAFAQTKTIETGNVTLRGREFDGLRHIGSAEEELKGYGVRIKSFEGSILAEKYYPISSKNYISAEMDKRAVEERGKDRPADGNSEAIERPLQRPIPPSRPPFRPVPRRP